MNPGTRVHLCLADGEGTIVREVVDDNDLDFVAAVKEYEERYECEFSSDCPVAPKGPHKKYLVQIGDHIEPFYGYELEEIEE